MTLAEKFKNEGHDVVADFVCPTPQTREEFNPDYIIWVDTITKGRFEDTNKVFVSPKNYDFKVTTKNADLWSKKIADQLKEKN